MKVFKRAIPIVLGSLIVAMVVSIIPFKEIGEAKKYDGATKIRKEVKRDTIKYISLDEAMEIAMKKVDFKHSEVTDFEIALLYEEPYYRIEITTTNNKNKLTVYKVKVDGISGKVLDIEVEEIKIKKDKKHKKENKKPVIDVEYITKDEAINIALERIGKEAKLDEIEFERDDNPPKYEIEMYDNKYEYEIEIHAISGAILKFEREVD